MKAPWSNVSWSASVLVILMAGSTLAVVGILLFTYVWDKVLPLVRAAIS